MIRCKIMNYMMNEKVCLISNVLSIIVSMNNSLAKGDKIPEFY
jgi:hypothetical protein